MALEIITQEEISKNSVVGMPEVPGLPAPEMQYRIEKVVREVAITKINEIIEYLINNGATKDDLEKLAIDAGAVTSVFGRKGAIKAQEGDYTPEQVGAAAARHAAEHSPNGKDPLDLEALEIAPAKHSHGALTFDGKIGEINGKVIMTGIGGVLEAVDKSVIADYVINRIPFYEGEVG